MDKTIYESYHVQCRANYTSVTNCSKKLLPSSILLDGSSPEFSNHSTSQSSDIFDVRTQCFICSKISKKTKVKGHCIREKLTSVTARNGNATHINVEEAAVLRNDAILISRMDIYQDLVACDAKYHSICYRHYITKTNINTAQSYDKISASIVDEEMCPDKTAFKCVVGYVSDNILSKKLDIVTSTELNTLFLGEKECLSK